MAEDREAIKAVFERSRSGGGGEGGDGGEGGGGTGGDGPSGPKVRFPGISPRAWEHPADRAALSALRKVPGFDQVVRKLFGTVSERSLRLLFLANAVRVDENQFTRIHDLYMECCAVLDVEEIPELFVAQTPLVNAGAIGVDKPFIVINSGTLELLDDEEARFVLAHELGHVLSGHALYKTMLHLLLNFALFRLPIAFLVVQAIVMALREWDRKSELSSDRCGLLCVQDPNTAYRVHMKMAGGGRTDEMSVDAFVRQAEEYEREGDMLDAALKVMNLLHRTHPFSVLRLAALKKWVDDGGFQDVVDGDYPRRDGDERVSFSDEVALGAEHYRNSLADGEDPISRLVQDLGTAGSEMWEQVRNMFGGSSSGDDDEEE